MLGFKLDKDNYLFAALIVVLVIVVAVFIYSLLQGRAPETFTQVWLGDNADVLELKLETFETGEVPAVRMDVNFFIENREGETTEYSYKIIAQGATQKEGEITVKDSETRNVVELIWLRGGDTGKQKVLIEISKPGKQEPYTLWFWVEVK